MHSDSTARFLLSASLLDPAADPLAFEFQRDLSNEDMAQVKVSRSAWQQMGPSQAAGYVVDRYLLEHPDEEQRVGRRMVAYCVNTALGLA